MKFWNLEKERERSEREKVWEISEREKEWERLEREKKLDRLEKEKERQFELDKLRVQNGPEINSDISTVSARESSSRKIKLKELVPKFEPKLIAIPLFIMIFERQAKSEKLEEEHWVSQLIPLLPPILRRLQLKDLLNSKTITST